MFVVVGTIINVAVLWWLSRRLLGVPIGWARTVAVSVLVNAFAYPLSRYVFTDPELLSTVQLVLLLILVAGWAVTLQLVVLTALEALIPTNSVPSLGVFVRDLPARWRRLRRTAGVWWILMRNGLSAFFSSSDAVRHLRDESRLSASLRRALTEGGVTFIKFGQMLSARADLLPESLVKELASLQSEVPPEPWPQIERVLTGNLGRPPQQVFAGFDRMPLAAASVAQVHAATLLDGSEVAVKIQRPRAKAQARADLDILRHLAARLERRTTWARSLGLADLVDGFATSLREELDYRVEAANMTAIAAADTGIRIPRVHAEFSTDQLLVMERIMGEPLSRSGEAIAALPPERRTELAGQLFRAIMHQVLISGVFHADLHPGNIILTGDGLALLDFGSVGRLDRGSRQALALLLQAVDREDAVNATDALIILLDRPSDLDDRSLQREVGQLILRFGTGEAATSAMFSELMSLVVRHGFTVPPQLAAAFRALGALEGSLRLLDPDLDLVGLARGTSEHLMSAYTSPDAVKDALYEQFATLLPMLQRLPRQVSRITEQLEDGSLTITVKGLSTVADDRYLRPLAQQITLSILAAALGLAGVAMLAIPGPELLPALSLWGYAGLWILLVAFVLGTRVLTGIFHSDAHH